MRIVIIGSGVTALGAAFRLNELGILNQEHQILIFEKESQIGGTAQTITDEKGFLWDIGGHITTSRYEYFDQILKNLGGEATHRQVESHVFRDGSFLTYPFNINTARHSRTLESPSMQTLHIETFKDWLQRKHDNKLCHNFFFPYNAKFWAVELEQMGTEWTQIVKRRCELPIFFFPNVGGVGKIWSKVKEGLPNGWFHLNHSIESISIEKKEVKIEHHNKIYTINYDIIINTMPLDSLIRKIEEAGPERRKIASNMIYTSTHVVGIGMIGKIPEILRNKHLIRFPESDIPFYRLTVFDGSCSKTTPDSDTHWSLMCECSDRRGQHRREEIVEDVITALVGLNFIDKNFIISKFHRRLRKGYPVPFLNRNKILDEIQPWLEENRIFSRGRFGSWKYEISSQDCSFMQGVEVVDRIFNGIQESIILAQSPIERLKPLVLKPRLDYEFVISRYNEKMDWIREFAPKVHIYDRGSLDSEERYSFGQWENLINVGRAPYAYLSHIINNYNQLAEVTIFLRGEISKLDLNALKHPYDYVSLCRKKNIAHGKTYNYSNWGNIIHTEERSEKVRNGTVRKAKTNFGQFWKAVFGKDHPKTIIVIYQDCFAVSRDRIQRWPLRFYEKLRSMIDDHVYPEEVHYIERIWWVLFH